MRKREREMNWLTVQDFIVSWVTAQIYTIGWPVQVCYKAAMTLSKIIFKFTLSQTEQYLLKFSSKTNNMCVQLNFFLIFRINKIVDYRSSEMNIYWLSIFQSWNISCLPLSPHKYRYGCLEIQELGISHLQSPNLQRCV